MFDVVSIDFTIYYHGFVFMTVVMATTITVAPG